MSGDIQSPLINPAPAFGTYTLLWSLPSANMNITTDQPLLKSFPFTTYQLDKIWFMNGSLSLTTAAGGIYTATSKGGTAIVAAAQVYTTLTTAAKVLAATINTTDLRRSDAALYLSLTTGQGAAATADLGIYGIALN